MSLLSPQTTPFVWTRQVKTSHYVQEEKGYTKDAISESIKPELTDEIVAGFEVDKPFTYQLGYDVQPTLTWKSPYKGLKVSLDIECTANVAGQNA